MNIGNFLSVTSFSLSLSLALSLSVFLPLSFSPSQISYAVTSKGPDEALSFYRTLPSFRSANVGRLLLLIRNRWFRIASISSIETFYAKVYNHIHVNTICT